MNNLFITYSVFVLVVLTAIYVLSYFTFVNKKINGHDWSYFATGILFFLLSVEVVNYGGQVNDRLNVEFKVPTELYAPAIPVDSIITDAVLYNHLLMMRAPHAKIMLAQAKHESSNYTSSLFKRAHNLFGMKVATSRVTTGGGDSGSYKFYSNWTEGLDDYIFWQFAHNTDKMTDTEYLSYVGKVYAEDPNYLLKIDKLLKTIDYKKLTR